MLNGIVSQLEKPLQEFEKRELEPRWEGLDRRNPEALAEILRASSSLGLSPALIPEELGGPGFPPPAGVFIIEELAASVPALAALFAIHFSGLALALDLPDGGEKAKLLEVLLRPGEAPALVSVAVFEEQPSRRPEEFAASLASRVEGSQASGGKKGVVLPGAARVLFVLARDGSGGLSWVPLDPREPQLEALPLPEPMGLRLLPLADLGFRDLPAPKAFPADLPRFFARAEGFEAAVAVGLAQGAFNRTLRYTQERWQGGKMICDQDAVRGLLADRLVAVEAARSLSYRSVMLGWSPDSPGGEVGAAAFAAELAPRVALDCIQLHGGYGYMEDYRVERFLRDAKTYELLVVRAHLRQAWALARLIAQTRG